MKVFRLIAAAAMLAVASVSGAISAPTAPSVGLDRGIAARDAAKSRQPVTRLPQRYRLVPVAAPGALRNPVIGVNDVGDVVYPTETSAGRIVGAFAREGEGPVPVKIGTAATFPWGVTATRQVFGWFRHPASGAVHAFLYDAVTGKAQDLSPHVDFCVVAAVSRGGRYVVGWQVVNGEGVPFWRDLAGGPRLAGLPDRGQILAVNSRGECGGLSDNGRPFVVDRAGYAEIGYSGLIWAAADTGEFAGALGDDAITWSRDHGVRRIGRLGAAWTIAEGINDRGQVVGFGGGSGFVWNPKEGALIDLNAVTGQTPFWVLYAQGINNRGEIAVVAVDPESRLVPAVLRPL